MTQNHLAVLLAESGWGPRHLADLVNGVRPGTVSRTAPYKWLVGAVPRPPVPQVCARLFSDHLRRSIIPTQIWPTATAASPSEWADHGLAGISGTPAGSVKIAQEWIGGGTVRRRTFLAVTGSALLTAVAGFPEPPRVRAALAGDRFGSALADQIEAGLPGLRALDHQHGGGAALYARGQHAVVASLLADGDPQGRTRQRLLGAFAEISDLLGYMSWDAGDPGLAQRYTLTGLHAAHAAEDRALTASLLGNLSYQTAGRDPAAAVQLAHKAVTAARHTPMAVQAGALSRLAIAYAYLGDHTNTDQALNDAEDLLHQHRAGTAPDWSMHVTSRWLHGQAAQANLALSRRTPGPTGRNRLDAGIDLLTPLTEGEENGQFHRSTLLRTLWLARGHLTAGRLDQACTTGTRAVNLAAHVDSTRAHQQLSALATSLRTGRHAHPSARTLHEQIVTVTKPSR